MLNQHASEEDLAREAFEAARAASLPPSDGADGGAVHLWRTQQSDHYIDPSPFDPFEHYSDLGAVCDDALAKRKHVPISSLQRNAGRAFGYDLLGELLKGPSNMFCARNEGFVQDLNFKRVRAFLEGEWTEGADKIAQELEILDAPQTASIKRRRVYDESEGAVCEERFRNGDWDKMYRRRTKKNVMGFERVRIVVDLGSSCGRCDNFYCDVEPLRPENLFWRGGAAASLCDTLEQAGYQVEIVAGVALRRANSWRQERERTTPIPLIDRTTGKAKLMPGIGYAIHVNGPIPGHSENTVAVTFTVKEFDAPLNYGLVASATCHASVARRVLLANIVNKSQHETDGGCLDSLKNPRVIEALNLETPETCTVYVDDWVLNARNAGAWVRGTLYGLEHRKTGLNLDNVLDDDMESDQE